MKTNMLMTVLSVLAIATGCATPSGEKSVEMTANVKQAKEEFLRSDNTLEPVLAKASGYVIFPSVATGALGVGAASGEGELFEKGNPHPVGNVALNQMTVGFQAGGQAYSELILFQDQTALDNFKTGSTEFSAQTSAVAAAEGVSANAKYEQGVMVMTLTQGGLMYQAAIGGQKFDYKPY
ncbi:MAG TPA: hypothetical protein VMH87_10880 [Pseudomonadales bacterium]|nr:hypothetical protein [Pseudomonadales bacterium]